ncbi:hypothetical protein DKX38_003079 [Salix brachista]|uniref:Reverse transcriptase Ty1/copia-type domain-containing protein n=1 Tax=Salix brachista TaxID=2182728 RepID=A0A5N5NSD0_9ROSI|nr:hypothetical protein DKX38_003079 [Salix brachista]
MKLSLSHLRDQPNHPHTLGSVSPHPPALTTTPHLSSPQLPPIELPTDPSLSPSTEHCKSTSVIELVVNLKLRREHENDKEIERMVLEKKKMELYVCMGCCSSVVKMRGAVLVAPAATVGNLLQGRVNSTTTGKMTEAKQVLQTLRGREDASGQQISDEELTLYILGGLGHDYDSVVVNMTSRHDQVTLQEVQYMLQNPSICKAFMVILPTPLVEVIFLDEIVAEEDGAEEAIVPYNTSSHITRTPLSSQQPFSNDNQQAYYTSTSDTPSDNAWYQDSGVTHHIQQILPIYTTSQNTKDSSHDQPATDTSSSSPHSAASPSSSGPTSSTSPDSSSTDSPSQTTSNTQPPIITPPIPPTHHMITRSKLGIFKPKTYLASILRNPNIAVYLSRALQYLTLSRPDIAFSVNKLSQFLQSPTQNHWQACKRILRYLAGSIGEGIQFTNTATLSIESFCDSDWASSLDDQKSTSGYCVYLGGNLISWSSRKQKSVARSSTEAEYRALAQASIEIMWLNSLLSNLIKICKNVMLFNSNA